MTIALLTNYLAPYRNRLYQRLADRHPLEVLLYGGGERYIPPWFADLDDQIAHAAFPARRMHGPREAATLGRHHEILIAPFAGGPVLPAAYFSARRHRRRFILWASVWAEPHSLTHTLARPLVHHIYRHSDSLVAYGEHTRRFAAAIRGHDEDIFVAPQSVEPEIFGRQVSEEEQREFRRRHRLGDGPLVLYSGRLVPEKGVGLLTEVWRRHQPAATLILVGDGPLAAESPGVRWLGTLPRDQLPPAYATSAFSVLPSLPTPRFREPWGLVVNEAMHQGAPVIASDAVGAAAGGLVRDGETGLVVRANDPGALAQAIDRLLLDDSLRRRLGAGAREAVAAYSYDAMVAAFDHALEAARAGPGRRW